jgi:hypothetical protein
VLRGRFMRIDTLGPAEMEMVSYHLIDRCFLIWPLAVCVRARGVCETSLGPTSQCTSR